MNFDATAKRLNSADDGPPSCIKCGTTMCQQFDDRPINAIASMAIPNGKYICYRCGHIAPDPRLEEYNEKDAVDILEEIDRLRADLTARDAEIKALKERVRKLET